jgi:enhancing lycopene biosynthesis protein 2
MITTQTIKISKDALKQLRMIHALTGERMTETLARLVAAELARVQKEVATAK